MKSPSRLFDLKNNLENDEYIKKYGKHFQDYQSLNYFDFENESTKFFCESLISLKIKLVFLMKVSLFLLTLIILTIILFSFLNASFIKDNNGLLISACCFATFTLILFFYIFYLAIKTYLFVKKILFFSESNKFIKLKKIKFIFLVFFWSLANLIIFCFITFLISVFLLNQVMNDLKKNYQILGIKKKNMV